MKKSLFIIWIAVLLGACGSQDNADTAIATAEIGAATPVSTLMAEMPTDAEGGTSVATATPEASNGETATAPEPAANPDSPANTVADFLGAYQSDAGQDAAATYFDDGLTGLYNSGNTVRTIVGVDPSFVEAQVVAEAPYNDNQNVQVTTKLTYPAGSETVVITLEQTDAGWKVAAVAPNPQK